MGAHMPCVQVASHLIAGRAMCRRTGVEERKRRGRVGLAAGMCVGMWYVVDRGGQCGEPDGTGGQYEHPRTWSEEYDVLFTVGVACALPSLGKCLDLLGVEEVREARSTASCAAHQQHLPCVGRKEPSSWQRCKASGMGGGWRAAEAAVLVAVKAVVSGEWGGGRRRGSPTQFHDTQQGSMAEPWAAAAMVAVNWAAWQSLDGAAVVVVKAVGNDRGGRRAGGRRGRLTHGEEGSLSQQKP
ncbi:unnamed protein product [Closterium sp. NIES-64]|nr:unnamed protein product [Closterium sp. NIES-64]